MSPVIKPKYTVTVHGSTCSGDTGYIGMTNVEVVCYDEPNGNGEIENIILKLPCKVFTPCRGGTQNVKFPTGSVEIDSETLPFF